MERRRLGHGGPQVSAIGLGCMSIGIADVYTSSVKDDVNAIELIHYALDLGLNFSKGVEGRATWFRLKRYTGPRSRIAGL
jgi:predicted aldo/keto reductase-like oxidoreductase